VDSFTPNAYGRTLAPGQHSVLKTLDVLSGETRVVLRTPQLIEAPNWMPDGNQLIFNAGGQLWRIEVAGGTPERVDTGGLADLNNDHVLSPDGRAVFVSSDDGHLYRVALEGGAAPLRISNDHPAPYRYYLHGVSPDGAELAYVAIDGAGADARRNICTIPAAGGADRCLLESVAPSDGPEYSPDGRWIYFNSELRSADPGHAQIFRMARDGSGVEQLTFDARVNWFPHLSPDGTALVWLSYPPGTLGHPPDRTVRLRRMRPDGTGAVDLLEFFGGQGTINVNSWSPDSRHVAFVAYPMA